MDEFRIDSNGDAWRGIDACVCVYKHTYYLIYSQSVLRICVRVKVEIRGKILTCARARASPSLRERGKNKSVFFHRRNRDIVHVHAHTHTHTHTHTLTDRQKTNRQSRLITRRVQHQLLQNDFRYPTCSSHRPLRWHHPMYRRRHHSCPCHRPFAVSYPSFAASCPHAHDAG